MKICDLTQPYSSVGGGVRTYLNEKQGYIRRTPGIEHVLIVPGERDSVIRTGRLIRYTMAGLPLPGGSNYRFSLRIDRILRILEREKPDILEFGCAYAMPIAGFRHRKRNRCALVGFYHTDYPSVYVQRPITRSLGPGAGEWGRNWAERHARAVYNRFDLTIAPTACLAEKLRRLEIQRVEHVPLAVDMELFRPGRRDGHLREFIGAGDGDRVFIYAGRLDTEKGVDVILDAASRCREENRWRFLFVGEGPLKAAVQEAAAVDPRIRILPFEKSRYRLARLLASSDVYVSAHPHETFGLSVAEAQACGLPVIGADSAVLRERIPAGTGALFAPGSGEDLVRCMRIIDADDPRRMGLRARAWAESQGGWPEMFARLFAHYDRLAEERA